MIVGLIGAGNMGGAIARGWAASDAGPDRVLVFDIDEARAKELVDATDGKRASSARELAEDADVVLLAVKPGALDSVAQGTRVTVSERRLPVVSILGGISIERVERAFGPGTPVLRLMPNVAAEVRAGTFLYAANDSLNGTTRQRLLDIFGLLGELVAVEERLMDAGMAISACGPAFLALVAEALVDAGVKEGLAAAQATELAVATMEGTGALLRRHERDMVGIRRRVTSPGGTTAAGLAALEGHHVRAAFSAAVEAAVARARELAS
jgi:pyrroline-5-carboxylate reductase